MPNRRSWLWILGIAVALSFLVLFLFFFTKAPRGLAFHTTAPPLDATRGLAFQSTAPQFRVTFPIGFFEQTSGTIPNTSTSADSTKWMVTGATGVCGITFSNPEATRTPKELTREKQDVFHMTVLGLLAANNGWRLHDQDIKRSLASDGTWRYSGSFSKPIPSTGTTYQEDQVLDARFLYVFTEDGMYQLVLGDIVSATAFQHQAKTDLDSSSKRFFDSFDLPESTYGKGGDKPSQ